MTKKKVKDGKKWKDRTKTERIPLAHAFVDGNRIAVGHGRPPNEGTDDLSLDILGKELLEWMKRMDADPKSNIVHLSQWYCEEKNISPTEWFLLVERPRFSKYYDLARAWMGRKLMQNKELPTAYGSRFLAMYCRDLRGDEEHIKDRQAERDRGVQKQSDANLASLIADAQSGKIRQDD